MSYYEDVNETINPGWIADAKKINDIQENIKSAQSNEIIDLDGPAFVLSSEEDAFELSIPSSSTNVENQVDTDPVTWQSLENQYIRRRIDITKNEIRGVKLFLRNNTTDPVTVTVNLYTSEFEEDYETPPIKSSSVTISASNPGEYLLFWFGVNHLSRYYHYLEIERTDIAGVDIKLAQMGESSNRNQSKQTNLDSNRKRYLFLDILYG